MKLDRIVQVVGADLGDFVLAVRQVALSVEKGHQDVAERRQRQRRVGRSAGVADAIAAAQVQQVESRPCFPSIQIIICVSSSRIPLPIGFLSMNA